MTDKETILAVIDADAEDLSAAERAAYFAEGSGARIELFSSIFDPYIAGERLFDSEDLIAAKEKRLAEQREKLEDVARPLRDDGFDVVVDVVWDEPAYEGIVRKVLRTKPAMVIRNNHYHHALQRGLFSNDDWNLIRTCPAPLLITRHGKHPSERMNICAAVDPMHAHDKPAELDHEILKTAIAIADRIEGDVSVVHCYDAAAVIAGMAAGSMTPIIPDTEQIAEQVRDEHWVSVAKLLEPYGVAESDVHHLPGNPRMVLPGFVAEQKIDLMVMGAVSRGFLERTFIGNTAEQVLDRMPCDLLIIKPANFECAVKHDSRHRFHPE
ncbi:MAG: universal stress protein [Pseudomonadota bacterium]